ALGKKTDSQSLQPIVDVAVMNDFSREKNPPVGKFLNRFICINDGALYAVTETELHCEKESQAAGLQSKAICAHQIHNLAAIIFEELRTNFRAKTKSFLKVRSIHRGSSRGL